MFLTDGMLETKVARAGSIESRVEFEAGPAAMIPARERFYADLRPARRGNAPLRQTGSTVGPVPSLSGARV
jgi:hypothetical protein